MFGNEKKYCSRLHISCIDLEWQQLLWLFDYLLSKGVTLISCTQKCYIWNRKIKLIISAGQWCSTKFVLKQVWYELVFCTFSLGCGGYSHYYYLFVIMVVAFKTIHSRMILVCMTQSQCSRIREIIVFNALFCSHSSHNFSD